MESMQPSFPHLKDMTMYEEIGERKVIMKMIILLYNLRAQHVGINQILNMYMPELERDVKTLFIAL